MKKTALILGASGLTGKLLLNRLLSDETYESVKVFSRRNLGLKHAKLKVFVGDLLNLESFESDFFGDELFCCIGTTASKTKDKAIYKQIDFGIPKSAAKLCKKNKIKQFLVVSALGANENSSVFYNRTKGEMESEVLKRNIAQTYILRPSLITGYRSEKRLAEAIASILMNFVQMFLIGKLKKYRAIEAETIATAMHKLANSSLESSIIESDLIEKWGSE